MKKTVIILLIILAASGISVAVWYFFFRTKKNAEADKSVPGTTGSNSTGQSSANTFSGLPTGSFPIKKGQKSKQSYLLQEALNQFGGTLILDGNFGPKTEAELKKQYNVTTVSKDLAATLMQKLIDLNKTNPSAQLTTLISRFATFMK